MRTWWKRVLGVLVLAVLPGAAQAAVTWSVVMNGDCTGALGATAVAGTATVGCCVASAAGGGNLCEEKTQIGQYNVRLITFAVAAGGAYTANGDALPAAQINKIGLNTLVWAFCGETQGTAASATGGQDVMWFPSAAPSGAPWGATIRLNQTGSGGTTGVTSGGQYVGNVANVTFQCELWGR